MRVGKPNELKTQAFPVLTARVSESELSQWFPVSFQHITDPQETAEPSKAALIRLDQGEYFVLFWGEWSRQLMLQISASTDASSFLDAFFREVPLPRTRILWRRHDARLPLHIAAKRISGVSMNSSLAKSPARRSVENSSGAKMTRKIRGDIKVGSLEKKLGLKPGAIRNVDGSDARSDKRLGTLRKEQQKEQQKRKK